MTNPSSMLTRLGALRTPHRGGHRCDDGRWYNDSVNPARRCPAAAHIDALTADVTTLTGRVHAAAHNDETALQVGLAAVGYTKEELADTDQPDDDREGVIGMGRAAIERLSEILDGAS